MYVFGILFFCITCSYVKARIDHDSLEIDKNPFQYLEEQQYPYENHTVITEDGYRLLLVRIPYNKNESPSTTTRPPILFVQGLLRSFDDFLFTGPQIAFGFKALEQGYDVFLSNVRGSRWSRSHISLDPDNDSKKFWNFSWHEIGIYDLPATIDYILNITKSSQVSYVGVSQGCTSFFVMASTRPEYNKKIKVAALLAPVSYLGHAKSIVLVLLKNIVGFLEVILEALHIHEIFRYNPSLSRTVQLICSPHSILLPICKHIIYDIGGPSTQTNDSLIYIAAANFPAGSSVKQVLHYLQNAKSKEFRQYDFGRNRNMLQYGQLEPPNYNLSAISAPLALYYGANDYLFSIRDEKILTKNLPNIVEKVMVPYNKTNHLDIQLGTRTEYLFTNPALTLINKYNNFLQ